MPPPASTRAVRSRLGHQEPHAGEQLARVIPRPTRASSRPRRLPGVVVAIMMTVVVPPHDDEPRAVETNPPRVDHNDA